MNLTDITFPVYRLLNKPPEWKNDMLVYENTYMHIDTANEYTHTKIVDAKIPGQTLSRRRLHMEAKGMPLYPLKKAAFFLHDFIKLAGNGYYFIDSVGKLFKYKKSKSCRLIFRKVTRIIPSESSGSIVEVQGLPQRFKTLVNLSNSYGLWAGLLEYNGTWLFFGVYNEQYRDTRRMI
jgi:hypothetical protein